MPGNHDCPCGRGPVTHAVHASPGGPVARCVCAACAAEIRREDPAAVLDLIPHRPGTASWQRFLERR